MSAPSVVTGRLLARQLARVSSTDVDDTRLMRFINQAYMRYWTAFVHRYSTFSLSMGVNASSQNVTMNTPEALSVIAVHQDNPFKVLERTSFGYLRWLLEQNNAPGEPEYFAVVPVKDSILQWTVYVYPRNGALPNPLTVWARVAPVTTLTTTGTPELTEAEAYWVYQMAAAYAAIYAGRTEDVPMILQGVPDAVLVAGELKKWVETPRLRSEETAVG